jgi:hypothetical protein
VHWAFDHHVLKFIPLMFYRNHYEGSRAVTITFRETTNKYPFPRELLVNGFKYFTKALRIAGNQPVFAEGDSCCLQFPEIAAATFGRLLRYAQSPTVDTLLDCTDINRLLQILIAADYLALRLLPLLRDHVCGHLAAILLADRRKLTSAHLFLVDFHRTSITGWANHVWKLFADAGVRPFLQSWHASEGVADLSLLYPGNNDVNQWVLMVRHCCQLSEESDRYALEVARRVMEMIRNARLDQTPARSKRRRDLQLYRDPLSEYP